MRGLLPALAVAQALGILLADRALLDVAVAFCLGVVGVAFGLGAKRARTRAAAALLVAAASGALGLAQRLEAAAGAKPVAQGEVVLEGVVRSVRVGSAGARVELAAARATPPGPETSSGVLLSLAPESRSGDFEPGARVRLRARQAAPRPPRNPGARDVVGSLARRGIGLTARLTHAQLSVRFAGSPGFSARLDRLRSGLAARLARAGHGSALLRALALGDTSEISPETRGQFARLGLAHLLAVSGLHLALVAGGAYAAARRLLARSAGLASRVDVREPARLAALLAATLYALVCGFGIPVRRSLWLVGAVVVTAARARRSPPFHPLAIAAIAVLASQPEALFTPGAQLSFAACAALVWCTWRTSRVEAHASGWRASLASAAGASAAAAAVTAPLAAWHFGTAAPLAVVVNLVAIPWTGMVLLPAALVAAAAAALPPTTFGDLAIGVAAQLASATLRAGASLADLVPPGPETRVQPLAIAGAAALALVVLRSRSSFTRALLASLLAFGLWSSGPATLRPAPPRLVALDVGRGDSVLVEGRRAAMLVDAGAAVPGRFDAGRSVVVPALRALGVEHLELLVATHADLDHRGGIVAVLRALPVGKLWLPRGEAGDPDFAELLAEAHARGVPVEEVGHGSPPTAFGDLHVTPLWPTAAARAGSRNERSLGLRVEVGGRRVLLLGDLGVAESELVARNADLRAEVLLLPHHGSGGSSSQELLAAVAPELAILSAPCPPRRGLPHEAVLERAREAGLSVWWTGRDGALLVGLGERLHATGFARRRVCD